MKNIFLLLLFYTSLHANVTIYNEMQDINNFELDYYYDVNKSLDIKSIQKLDFKEKTSNFFTFGYIDGDSWFRLKVTNQSQSKDFIFQLVEPFFQHVHFYAKKNGTWHHQEADVPTVVPSVLNLKWSVDTNQSESVLYDKTNNVIYVSNHASGNGYVSKVDVLMRKSYKNRHYIFFNFQLAKIEKNIQNKT